jgi:hypothetical protein
MRSMSADISDTIVSISLSIMSSGSYTIYCSVRPRYINTVTLR